MTATIVVAPEETARPAVNDGDPAAAADAKVARAEDVPRLARAALSKPVDFGSASRIEINRQFPEAERVKDALVRAGAPFDEGDWFGESEPEPPAGWEVALGADVDVPAAQAVIGACIVEGDVEITLVRMSSDGNFGNRKRIYIGSLDAKPVPPTSRALLAKLLSPGISKKQFYALFEHENDD